MKMLNRKLIRDLKGSKGLLLAVTLIIMLAVAFFGCMYMTAQNLGDSYDHSYAKLKFADFTVKTAQDASAVVDELGQIDGVAAVTARSNSDFTLNLPASAKSDKVLARVISLPSDNALRANMVDDVYVDKGEYFPAGGGNYLLVEKNFADHHGLTPGQSLSLTVDGNDILFTISGIAVSPEYIFAAKSRQEILVSPNVWGVVFVSGETAAGVLGQSTNEFCFLTQKGSNRADVIARVSEVLQPYQVMETLTKEDQPSYAGLNTDLEQFNTLAELFPLLFIIVGTMATYIMLTRIVYNQRSQIGLMRAMGYSRRQVMNHYLGFSLVIGLIGAILGSIAGYFLSEAMTRWYASVINLPFTKTSLQWDGLVIGFLLGFLPCFLSGLLPARAASRMAPAEAMRAPAPSAGRKLLIERLFPFLTRLSSMWKIPLRNVFRNRKRSFYTVVGVTFGVALILVSAGMIDSMTNWVNYTFNKVQRYDVQIEFADAQPVTVADQVSGWDGVSKVEPFAMVPTLMEYNGKTFTTYTLGYPADGVLRGIYTTSGKETHPSGEGVLLSQGLKNTLHIKTGDTLNLSFDWGSTQQKVIGFVKEPMGSFGYMTFDKIQGLAVGQNVVNGLHLKAASSAESDIRTEAYQLEGVSSVELTSENQAEINKMLQAGLGLLGVMLLFGAVLAAAIVFTTITVNILERRREIATMRTLGESKRRISIMVTIENLILGFTGLIPGVIMGYFLTVYFFSLFQGDIFNMDVVIYARTYVLVSMAVIMIVLVSQLPSIRSLGKINLATATKEQAS